MTGRQGEVLVAVMNNMQDMEIARELHWYRIPVTSVEKFLKRHWAPDWLAFYQTKVFGDEAYAVNYYARVEKICKVYRWQLFPGEELNENNDKQYYKLELSALQRLEKSILSPQRRRIHFIQTTLEKLKEAAQISDL
jgi:hypothetical protein